MKPTIRVGRVLAQDGILSPGNDIYAFYTHNWQDNEIGLRTLDRRLATKLVITYPLCQYG